MSFGNFSMKNKKEHSRAANWGFIVLILCLHKKKKKEAQDVSKDILGFIACTWRSFYVVQFDICLRFSLRYKNLFDSITTNYAVRLRKRKKNIFFLFIFKYEEKRNCENSLLLFFFSSILVNLNFMRKKCSRVLPLCLV